MKLKTYHSNSVQAAVRLAKIELGEEAVFLGSRDCGDGEGGYEVTFARLDKADDEPRPSMSAAEQVEFASNLAETFAAQPTAQPAAQPAAQPVVGRYHWKSYLSAAAPARALESAPSSSPPETRPAEPQRPELGRADSRDNDTLAQTATGAASAVEPETKEKSSSLERFSTALNVVPFSPQAPTRRVLAPQKSEPRAIDPSGRQDAELLHLRDEVRRLRALVEPGASARRPIEQAPRGTARQRLKRELESRGLDEPLAERLLLGDDEATDGGASYGELRAALENRSSSLWTTNPSIGRPGSSPRIAALVGPPGCGKTSALVKLAIRYGLGQRWAIHLISVDQMRVGAMEPLEAYAALLAAPLSAVDEPEMLGEELQRVCCGESRPDLVLIDTPGYAPAERERAAALAEALRAFDAIDVHLVLPGGLGADDLRETAARFDAFEADKLLFTKLDETVSPGALLGEHLRSGRPVSFLSRGQRVPEDLAPAGGRALTRLLLGEPAV